MSRIGRMPVSIPDGVDVKLGENNVITVKGPKGELTRRLHPDMKTTISGKTLSVERPSDERDHRALHGLTRSLIANMVEGVTDGFSKELAIVGTGYRAQLQGKKLVLALGYSHPIEVDPPDGIEFEVPAPVRVIIRGADKQVVGQVAADVRRIRKPDAYKGKGIRYAGEHVRQKEGKKTA